MEPIRNLRSYLSDRYIGKHRGAQLLLKHPGYAFRIETIIVEAIEMLQLAFTKTSITNNGECKLTAVSTKIGEMAAYHLGLYDRVTKSGLPWWDVVKMGDLILEAFLQCKYINIEYTHYDYKEMHKCYIISWGEQWNCLNDIPNKYTMYTIRGSRQVELSLNKLKNPITGLPTIKGMYRERDFQNLKNSKFLKAGNKLVKTKWKINKRLLKALENLESKLDLSNKSKATEYNIILRKAGILSKLEWFCQFIDYDYRGRVYYTEPFVNFQGSDYARGIMQFYNGKVLDHSGQWWLAVHTANCYNKSYTIDRIPDWLETDYKSYLIKEELDSISVDKMTLEDKVRWVNNNMDLIIECAKKNRVCIESAEKPISFLACCYEWEAIDKDPNHVCHLPVPIDGSNNGWQHLGAISKDYRTAGLVGLIPTKIQDDFYVQTAKELKKLMIEWFEDRDMPMKHIRKGISKRGSMTRAYSAGAEKIAENMYKDCKQEGYTKLYGITKEDCKELAKNLIKAINMVCDGPLKTMKFLQKIAQKKLETNNHLQWNTPSGFPVKYIAPILTKYKTRSILLGVKTGKNQHIKHTIQAPKLRKENNTPIPDKKRFASGISPNYVHSMDASHMALVIYKWQGDFGAIHDSFSTHANDIEHLLELTKEEFIRMYNHINYFDIIQETFKVEMNSEDIPHLGNLNIKEVQESDYFFS